MRAINLDAGDGSEIYQGEGAQPISVENLTYGSQYTKQLNSPVLWLSVIALAYFLTRE